LTHSLTLIFFRGIGDSFTRNCACVVFPVPGVPVMMMTGPFVIASSKVFELESFGLEDWP
jgi:hypothetical protein